MIGKITTTIALAIFLLYPAVSSADVGKYKECAKQFAGEETAAQIDILVGVFTFDIIKMFKGAKKDQSVYDKIRFNCDKYLTDAERHQRSEMLRERGRALQDQERCLRFAC